MIAARVYLRPGLKEKLDNRYMILPGSQMQRLIRGMLQRFVEASRILG